MDANEILENIDRRIYDLEQLLTSGTGPGSNTFTSLNISSGTGQTVAIQWSASPPTSLVITPGTYFDLTFADVSWTAPVDGSAGKYQVEWAKKNGPGVYELVDVKVTGGNTFRIWDLIPQQAYGVRVFSMARGTDRLSTGLPSSGFTDFTMGIDASQPAPPTGLVLFSTIKSIIARVNANGEIDVKNGKGIYKFELATDAGFTNIIKTNIEGGLVSYFPDLEVNTQYWVRVWVVDSSGNQSTGPSASGTVTTSFVMGSDTSMLPSGTNWVKNSIFIRDSDGDHYPDYWGRLSGNISNTEGHYIETSPGGVQGNAYKIQSATAGDYFGLQVFDLTKGKWVVGARIKRTSVVPGTGHGSGVNVDVNSGTVSMVRRWDSKTSNAPFDSWDLMTTGTNDWRWEWVVIDVTSDNAQIYVYLQQGHQGTCTGTTRFGEVQVERGDTPAAWHGIPPQIVTADEVYAGSMTTAVFTTNTLNADRLTANSADVSKLMTSSLTTQTITLAGGSFVAGSPPTTGLLINSQGIRLYSGGTQTIALDVGGTLTITGGSMSSPTISGGTITSTTMNANYIQTAASGQRLIISNASPFDRLDWYDGSNRHIAQIRSGTQAILIEALANTYGQNAYVIFQSIDTYNTRATIHSQENVVEGGKLIVLENIVVGGLAYAGGMYANNSNGGMTPDVNWGFDISNSAGGYYTTMRYYGSSAPGSACGIFNMAGTWVAYGDTSGNWISVSSASTKKNIRTLTHRTVGRAAGESMVEKVRKVRAVRYFKKMKKEAKKMLNGKAEREYIGIVAEELNEVFPEATSDPAAASKSLPMGINTSVTTGILWAAVQELADKIDALTAAQKAA